MLNYKKRVVSYLNNSSDEDLNMTHSLESKNHSFFPQINTQIHQKPFAYRNSNITFNVNFSVHLWKRKDLVGLSW